MRSKPKKFHGEPLQVELESKRKLGVQQVSKELLLFVEGALRDGFRGEDIATSKFNTISKICNNNGVAVQEVSSVGLR